MTKWKRKNVIHKNENICTGTFCDTCGKQIDLPCDKSRDKDKYYYHVNTTEWMAKQNGNSEDSKTNPSLDFCTLKCLETHLNSFFERNSEHKQVYEIERLFHRRYDISYYGNNRIIID